MTKLASQGLLIAYLLLSIASGAQPVRHRMPYQPNVVLQLAVTDLDRSIRFYVDVLDFKLTGRRDDLGFAHIQTNVPGLELGLAAGSTKSGNGASIINLSVHDVAAARALLEQRGVSFPKPAQVIPGKVTLLAFTDPDLNQLRLAGPAPK